MGEDSSRKRLSAAPPFTVLSRLGNKIQPNYSTNLGKEDILNLKCSFLYRIGDAAPDALSLDDVTLAPETQHYVFPQAYQHYRINVHSRGSKRIWHCGHEASDLALKVHRTPHQSCPSWNMEPHLFSFGSGFTNISYSAVLISPFSTSLDNVVMMVYLHPAIKITRVRGL